MSPRSHVDVAGVQRRMFLAETERDSWWAGEEAAIVELVKRDVAAAEAPRRQQVAAGGPGAARDLSEAERRALEEAKRMWIRAESLSGGMGRGIEEGRRAGEQAIAAWMTTRSRPIATLFPGTLCLSNVPLEFRVVVDGVEWTPKRPGWGRRVRFAVFSRLAGMLRGMR